jgi:hypothetical protein
MLGNRRAKPRQRLVDRQRREGIGHRTSFARCAKTGKTDAMRANFRIKRRSKDGRVQAHAVPESFVPYGEHSLLLHRLKA